MTIRNENECALCYHEAEKGKLCMTCHADWKASCSIAAAQLEADSEYHGIMHNSYPGQAEYIEEFYARDEQEFKPQGKPKLRFLVTQSICKEIGCDPPHAGE